MRQVTRKNLVTFCYRCNSLIITIGNRSNNGNRFFITHDFLIFFPALVPTVPIVPKVPFSQFLIFNFKSLLVR